jgi:uncharacterized protein DUF1553/uncharacterized protein DUF1549/cytochrome c
VPLPPLLLLTLGSFPQGQARNDQDLEQDLAFFESKVRPVLVEHCYECHGAPKKRPKGGLRLDTRAGWELGGDSGPALVPGDAEASRLVRAIRYTDADLEMPPDGKLPAEAIAVLEEWVRRGAPDPRTETSPGAENGAAPASSLEARAAHWSFQPMADPTPPAVRDEGWVRNEIDRFVLARLESEGLAPVPEADRRTLLRRASEDLLGLPPTEAELARFVDDPAPDAWEREIERLLASPHYGERWGRRWLDLARYADSNGLDENLALANAWRYRDWVVRALNADLPYDRFVTQQLAGDLLPEPAPGAGSEAELADQLTATGFLVLGPKMLAEQDKVKLQRDVVDEQLDVASQAFLGLTMGCARCHDHKFDPLTQRDYTALAGVFQSTKTMANLEFVSRWNQRALAPKARIAEREAQVAAITAARAEADGLLKAGAEELRRAAQAELARYLLAAAEASARALVLEAEEYSRGNLHVDREQFGSATNAIIHTSEPGPQFVEYDLTLATPARLRLEVRYASESARPVRVSLDGKPVVEAALAEPTGGWRLDAQRWTRVALLELGAGRSVLRIEREGDFPHLDQLLLVPAETLEDERWLTAGPWAEALVPEVLRAWVGRLEQAARGADPVFAPFARAAALPAAEFEARAAELWTELRARRSAEPAGTNALVATLFDGLPPTSLRELASRYQTLFGAVGAAWDAQRAGEAGKAKERLDEDSQEELRLVLHGAASPFTLSPAATEALLDEPRRNELAAARATLASREAALLPAFELALGVEDAAEPVALPIHVRGSHLNLSGEPVPRGFPAVLTARVPAAEVPAESSGRLELARWLTEPEHPLTARVIANRVWQGHFGQGIVRTPSNFGLRGTPPTHPELLDWLARTLIRDGWSLKALHRRILLSAAYRMDSVPSAESLARDPENAWLAHQNRLRLDAEGVRDALLARAGLLDLALGGSLLGANDGDYVTNDQSSDQARYGTMRRSLYLPIVRNSMYDLFSAFDYRDPSLPVDARSSTTAPAQALWLMNSPLVLESSKKVADELTAAVAAPPARVEALYRRLLGRAPLAHERELALAFVAGAAGVAPTAGAVEAAAPAPEAAARAWQGLAHALFLSNEFLYVD